MVGIRTGAAGPGAALDSAGSSWGLAFTWSLQCSTLASAILMAVPRSPDSSSVVAGDRLLWVWTVTPLALLALATVKNAHYAISAQVPWSIWAALGYGTVGRSGCCDEAGIKMRCSLTARSGFATLALAYGLVFGSWALGLTAEGVEWAFYESAGRQFPSGHAVGLALRRLGSQSV